MIKKVIELNRLPKQEYQKPAMEVYEADIEEQILAASVTSVTTTGLDEDIEFDDTSEDPWESAW